MAQILIKAGEYLWSPQGTRIIDENGFAVKAPEDTICEVPDERYDFILSVVEADRQKEQELLEQEQKYHEETQKQEEEQKQPTPEELEAMWLQDATVSMRQARLALLEMGLLSDVEQAIQNLQEPQKSIAKIEWEYSAVVSRKNDTFLLIVEQLGIDSKEEIDNFFRLAKSL